MSKLITLINPNLVVQRSDPFTTGIVYMPIGLAYLAGVLREAGMECEVIDAFGEKPGQCWIDDGYMVRGLTPCEVADRISTNPEAVVLYASHVTCHRALVQIAGEVRHRLSHVPIVVIENTQAVTAYSIRRVQDTLYDAGVDYVLSGEPEERGIRLMRVLMNGADTKHIRGIDGVGCRHDGETHYTPPCGRITDLDALPFPAWELFPLRNYWRLRYAHGPFETDKYLPLLTSRGCPYGCRFCVIPETSGPKWHSRSPRNVVDEMEHYRTMLGVEEFHIEDVDPTVSNERTRGICEEILRRDLPIIWKICAGTKIETIRDEATVELMAKAGCRYVSLSPESGSSRVLRLMNKSFDFKHAVRLVKRMHECHIKTQACFVLGYPGETDEDLKLTWEMVHELTRVGIDEIALFVMAPLPGSEVFDSLSGYADFSELSFSPSWRPDYDRLNRFRVGLYRSFLLSKLRYHPLRLAKQPLNFLRRRFETKMEMVPYRALHTSLLTRSTVNR